MANVCVITGGGSGMGLEAAKFMPKDKIIVLSGRALSKLEGAVNRLKELGFDAYAKTCDTSNRESVKELGFALATVADERNGYLVGVDILCDGGSTNGMKEFKKKK